MKVVLINGSPRLKGNSSLVIDIFTKILNQENIDVEVLEIGSRSIRGCIACDGCKKALKCVLVDEEFHAMAQKVYEADGIFIVAPVYYCGMPGQLKTFLDRLFYQNRSGQGLRNKVACVASVQRRSGGVSTLDNLYHFILAAGMIIPPSEGENIVFGMDKGEARLDLEGIDIIERLAKNMAWMLKVLEATKQTIPACQFEARKQMNFIR